MRVPVSAGDCRMFRQSPSADTLALAASAVEARTSVARIASAAARAGRPGREPTTRRSDQRRLFGM